MKIVLTGGGTGGHFYPLIAVAEEINKIIDRDKILEAKIYYFSDSPYDKNALFENGITYEQISAGKMRIYFSPDNFFDLFKTAIGFFQALIKLWRIYPDIVFSKGGYSSFPVVFAARILRVPVFIHESDSYPGRVNKWAGKFAKRIAVAFEEGGTYFPKDKTAVTGLPIRNEILAPAKDGMFEFLKISENLPLIVVLGGSQGSSIINDAILEALPNLIGKYQIIHQVGLKNLAEAESRRDLILGDNPNKGNYRPYGFLNTVTQKMCAGAATLIISRAGSTIFEIASWGVPSIIIPITKSKGNHQMKNAYNYARSGGCVVMEEANLTPTVLAGEIDVLINDKTKLEKMRTSADTFAKRDAGAKIAQEIVDIALSHEE